MKTILTNLMLLFFACQLTAQITITADDFPLQLNDTVYSYEITNLVDVTVPEAGENVSWDYTNLEFSAASLLEIDFPAGTSPDFPEANIVSPAISTNAVFNVSFNSIFYAVLDEDGLNYLGRRDSYYSIPIGAVTMVETDSIRFLSTLQVYDLPVLYLGTPMTYGDEYSTEGRTGTTPFTVTATPFGLIDVPGEFRGERNDEDVINGWGTLVLNDPTTGDPVEVQSLLRYQEQTVVDSIFLGGDPAPQALLDNFGIVQGNETTAQNYLWYAKGFDTELMTIQIRNGIATKAYVNTEVAGYISALRDIQRHSVPVTVSPNPATDVFNLEFEKTDSKNWTFEMMDLLGRVVQQQTISDPTGATRVTIMPESTASGTYFYNLRNSNRVIVNAGKVILK